MAELTRRALLQAAAALGVAPAACRAREPGPSASMSTPAATARMPTVFLPHGGGTWPFMPDPDNLYGRMDPYMRGLADIPATRPRAVLIVSAHWEAPKPTVMSHRSPPMLYDYYNFPPETYEVKWPAPGAPELADEVRAQLEGAGIATDADAERGFDHGTFVPMALAYPEADVPTLQLSLRADLDPKRHLEMGRALAPLRDRGVFIVGSGMSYHNLRALMSFYRHRDAQSGLLSDSTAFDDWLAESVGLDADRRDTRLAEWAKAPSARACHPREEHLLPLHVVAGAAGDDPATLPYRDVLLGARVSAVHFG